MRRHTVKSLTFAFLLAACSMVQSTRAGPVVSGVGGKCGGFIGAQCSDGLWCDPLPDQCHAADGSGTCIRVPRVCTREYVPVCGCDGKTYPNDCERRAHRTGLEHKGPCKA